MSRVLLTGASGFIAAHCVEAFLLKGHFVRFTVRSQEKADQILKANEQYASQLEAAIVPGTSHSILYALTNDEVTRYFGGWCLR